MSFRFEEKCRFEADVSLVKRREPLVGMTFWGSGAKAIRVRCLNVLAVLEFEIEED